MKNNEIHTWAAFGTVFGTALLVAPVWFFTPTASAAPHKAPLEDMITIEATLAYKAPNAPKQPQKKMQEKEPDEKPPGVSVDDKQVPPPDPPKKKDEPKKQDPKDVDPLKKFQHPQDPDTPTADKATDNLPAFDGSKFGTDRTTTGHPFWQKLRADLAWEYPQILNAAQPAVGCIHLGADGKIAEIQIHTKSGDDSLDDAAERSLKKLQKLRNDNPIPVPVELLRSATTEWACFKFDASKTSD
jgi:outer membrane biosynthesis protein TonB